MENLMEKKNMLRNLCMDGHFSGHILIIVSSQHFVKVIHTIRYVMGI